MYINRTPLLAQDKSMKLLAAAAAKKGNTFAFFYISPHYMIDTEKCSWEDE